MTADELKTWRQRNGYSQAKLAKALGVDTMTVSRWERGFRKEIPPFLHLALDALERRGKEEKEKGKTEMKREV